MAEFQEVLDESMLHFDAKLDQDVASILKKNHYTISVAESVTGGLLADRLSSLPGSSDYFLGGIVCYHTLLKLSLCGVTPGMVKAHGVVSSEVALEMARGAQKLMKSAITISTTGVAGPATPAYPDPLVGTVFVGFSFPNGETVKQFKLSGEREVIRFQTTQVALEYLRQYLTSVTNEAGELFK